jgi:hypothetical protein
VLSQTADNTVKVWAVLPFAVLLRVTVKVTSITLKTYTPLKGQYSMRGPQRGGSGFVIES